MNMNNELKDVYIRQIYDGQEIQLYIDGNLEMTFPITGNIKVSTVPFYIGANPNIDAPSEFGNIKIKQSIIINRAINNEEELTALNEGKVIDVYKRQGLHSGKVVSMLEYFGYNVTQVVK